MRLTLDGGGEAAGFRVCGGQNLCNEESKQESEIHQRWRGGTKHQMAWGRWRTVRRASSLL